MKPAERTNPRARLYADQELRKPEERGGIAGGNACRPLAGASGLQSGSGDLGHVLGGGALLALDHLELDPVTLVQALVARALNGRVVNEAVLASVLRRDEAEALLVVEPLHSSGCHVFP